MSIFDLGGDNRLEPMTEAAIQFLSLLCWTALALILAGVWMAYMMSGVLDSANRLIAPVPAMSDSAEGPAPSTRMSALNDGGADWRGARLDGGVRVDIAKPESPVDERVALGAIAPWRRD
jgi:hypothetical protein